MPKNKNKNRDMPFTIDNITIQKKRNSSIIICNDNCIVENWKIQGHEVGKNKKKGTFLDKDPTILYSNIVYGTNCRIIRMLKNGNLADLRC